MTPLHLAVALDGAGWHSAAWRLPEARPTELLSAGYWTDLAQEAERGLLDLVTFEDALAPQSDTRPGGPAGGRVQGRLDAVLLAARVAPLTHHLGLVPTATVTHTEPFHLSKAIATLDHVSTGRAGWRPRVSATRAEADHVGRRPVAAVEDLVEEAGEVVEVVRQLWDSWEDDAEIRDAATGRFVDRDKLHHVDFEGRWFSVRGPSITPRPPQGQPVVVALSHTAGAHRFAARHADVVLLAPHGTDATRAVVSDLREEQHAAGREQAPLHLFGELVVHLDHDAARARDRAAHLDDLVGGPEDSDAETFVGTPADLADLLLERQQAGLTGFRLRPAALPHDLVAVTRGLVPELQRRGAFRTAYDAPTLRGRLGLPRPTNRYAAGAPA
ncbi:Flavin-dependent oxidoreductase, luciferase family (includes alkanesulfonate monooxygenase SsuD and methylene tetrahydromethanopterin reductase) [Nocardioides scoriae]|uniref:Flavin-dependent oxidoreductase, luciferase family (Includes alkanesulfonate monooxygenase SsuD and methylene tetrahydromethanopterin reductase) n=1 Tax=Nocardioides scoriae TaxID=642780 RepID=A0A1H1NYX2_9ACTN|nr:LLM class flavin-dependent oxidoreductase [Nocardioides scoriae]SDS04157.1 Flavin-dependent oxidoreductase, luciferase family (includes alkanesulfonate monooxygenase SsuD and methylene tetrahydromethanopterin reductase) [Nocardioides scoriae]